MYNLYTYDVTSIRVQIKLINENLHSFSMSSLSCTVDHGVFMMASAVEQRLHFGGQVTDGVDMATPCSFVQGILPTLQKG